MGIAENMALDSSYLGGQYMRLYRESSNSGNIGIKTAAFALHTWLYQGVPYAMDKAQAQRLAALSLLEMNETSGDPDLCNYLRERASTFGDFIDMVRKALDDADVSTVGYRDDADQPQDFNAGSTQSR